MDAVADSTEAHGAAAAEDDDVAAFFGAHGVIVVLFIRMVVGVIAPMMQLIGSPKEASKKLSPS